MAWISVHESVDGPKLRALHKKLGCSKFEAVGILNFLWFWGLTNAEKSGLVKYVDKDDIGRYLYGVGSGCELAPESIVDALFETGWIDEAGDGIYLHDWETWQDQWYKAKERREADAERKRKSRAKAVAEASETAAKTDSPAEVPAEKSVNKSESKKTPPTEKYTVPFEEFWNVYPRKVGKGEAYKKYKTRLKDGYSEEDLIQAAKEYARQCNARHTEAQYIKHARTFLSDNLPFLDYLPNRATSTPTPDDPFGAFEISEEYRRANDG